MELQSLSTSRIQAVRVGGEGDRESGCAGDCSPGAQAVTACVRNRVCPCSAKSGVALGSRHRVSDLRVGRARYTQAYANGHCGNSNTSGGDRS